MLSNLNSSCSKKKKFKALSFNKPSPFKTQLRNQVHRKKIIHYTFNPKIILYISFRRETTNFNSLQLHLAVVRIQTRYKAVLVRTRILYTNNRQHDTKLWRLSLSRWWSKRCSWRHPSLAKLRNDFGMTKKQPWFAITTRPPEFK